LPAIGAEGELALFRALQEALSNVARHAQATRVDVEVGIDDATLHLEVRDDGRGMGGRGEDVVFGNGRMGLTGMRERLVTLGGTLVLSPNAGGGLRLVARLPVPGRQGNT
jgi:signal transduction histidine kinase